MLPVAWIGLTRSAARDLVGFASGYLRFELSVFTEAHWTTLGSCRKVVKTRLVFASASNLHFLEECACFGVCVRVFFNGVMGVEEWERERVGGVF